MTIALALNIEAQNDEHSTVPRPRTTDDGARPVDAHQIGNSESPAKATVPNTDAMVHPSFDVPTEAAADLQPARWYRYLLLIPGLFFLGLGLLGVLLPGLPTTPFLLLASYFFIRSSPKLNQTLLNSRLFGPVLTDWHHRGGLRHHVKLKAFSVVSVTVAASAYLSRHNTPLMLLICAAASIGLIVIARLPTIR